MRVLDPIAVIPLDSATLCLTCNCITISSGDCCSYCKSKGVVSISKWLNRTENEDEEDVVTAAPVPGA